MTEPINNVDRAFMDALSSTFQLLGPGNNLDLADNALYQRICTLCRLQLNRVNSAHARQLDEIRTERDLLAAENGKLSAENGKLSAENGKLSAENGKLSAEKVKLVVEKDQFVSELADATLKQFNFETEIMTLSTRLKSVIPQHGVQPPPPAHARERNPIFEFSNSIHYALSSRGRFDSFEHVVGWCPLLLPYPGAEYKTASNKRSFADFRQGVVLCHARLDMGEFQKLIDNFRSVFQEHVHEIAQAAYSSLLSESSKRTNGKSLEIRFNRVLSFVMAAMVQFATNQIVVIDNLLPTKTSALLNHFLGLTFQPDMWARTADQEPPAAEAAKFVFVPSLAGTADLVNHVCANIISRAPSGTTPRTSPTNPPTSSTPAPTQLISQSMSQSSAADAIDELMHDRQNQLIADDNQKCMVELPADLIAFVKSQLRDSEYSPIYLSENKMNYSYVSALEEQFGQTLCLSSYFSADKVMFSFRICPSEMMVFVSLPLDMTDPLASGKKRMLILKLFSFQLTTGVAGMCQTAEIIGAVVQMAQDRSWVDMIQRVFELSDSKQLAYVKFDTFLHPCSDPACIEASRVADPSSSQPGTIENSQPSTLPPSNQAAASEKKSNRKNVKKSIGARPSSGDANSANSANDCDATSALEASKSLDCNGSVHQARPTSSSSEHYFVSLDQPSGNAELADGDNSEIIRPIAVRLQTSFDAEFSLSNDVDEHESQTLSRSTSEPRSEADSTSSGSSYNNSSIASKIARNSSAAVENLNNIFADVAI